MEMSGQKRNKKDKKEKIKTTMTTAIITDTALKNACDLHISYTLSLQTW
jgi:hypothetical protein